MVGHAGGARMRVRIAKVPAGQAGRVQLSAVHPTRRWAAAVWCAAWRTYGQVTRDQQTDKARSGTCPEGSWEGSIVVGTGGRTPGKRLLSLAFGVSRAWSAPVLSGSSPGTGGRSLRQYPADDVHRHRGYVE